MNQVSLTYQHEKGREYLLAKLSSGETYTLRIDDGCVCVNENVWIHPLLVEHIVQLSNRILNTSPLYFLQKGDELELAFKTGDTHDIGIVESVVFQETLIPQDLVRTPVYAIRTSEHTTVVKDAEELIHMGVRKKEGKPEKILLSLEDIACKFGIADPSIILIEKEETKLRIKKEEK